ncbi:hypothetical protein OJ996_21105 [Luteolibacter sp. GHJ8]|uniref:Uncharacterized protein n=2 Tax=Luteolibacter rhizosphaerae TaxID=2989719 RepID=A0ABT3G8C0_9BACT|nr:hypothetical protein [Luteolibacter rhizosphaerae]
MIPRNAFRAVPLCAFVAVSTDPASAQVQCWAPGMTSTVALNAANRSQTVALGQPYRYDVFGVAGSLTLGNSAANAVLVGTQFREKLLGLIPTGAVVSSSTYVRVQTGLAQFYPEQLQVSGNSPGVRLQPTQRYGANWTLCDPQNKVPVNLTFHMAGSDLLSSILPGLTSPPHYNLNSTGHFYVLGEYHPAPPEMSGELVIASSSAVLGSALEVGYEINREELPQVYRPPFLGLDLGDVNLTVIGTPPQKTDLGTSEGIDLPEIQTPDLLNVAIDLSGTQGNGWLKIEVLP